MLVNILSRKNIFETSKHKILILFAKKLKKVALNYDAFRSMSTISNNILHRFTSTQFHNNDIPHIVVPTFKMLKKSHECCTLFIWS